MKIITERLLNRPISLKNKHDIFAYRSDAGANKYQNFIPKSVEEVEEFISKNPKEINIPGSWFQLVIEVKETGIVIGDIGLHFIDDQQAELGITLNKEYHGKGFAKEALTAVIDYLFNELNKHRITASIDPENTASIKLFERIGFRKEAHHVNSIFHNGKWTDDAVYAMLKIEWQ